MKKNRKKIRCIYWIILILVSMALGIGRAALELSDFTVKIIMGVWLAVVVVSSITIDCLWYREFNGKLKEINLILDEQGDPEKYIIELNALMEGKHSSQIRQLHLINLGAAHILKRDYEKAKSLLLQAKPPKFGKINQVIYWADLALVHFYLKEEQSAYAIIAAQKNSFEQFKNNKQIGDILAILSIFQLVTMGEKEKAKQQLDKARKQWESPRNMSDFTHLESLINM